MEGRTAGQRRSADRYLAEIEASEIGIDWNGLRALIRGEPVAWARSARVYSIRVRRCAVGIDLLGEAWKRGIQRATYRIPVRTTVDSPAGARDNPGRRQNAV